MPATVEFSGFYQLSNSWSAHYRIMYTQWSGFEKLEAFTAAGAAFEKQENFEDS